ncbi:hypothetical protein QSH46_022195 [Xanthomonas arboricola pv. juglandis]|uniref:hypothetical protein n=1 Tax=Xanthomonas TaxID=338 RepID=UPI0003710303|nr:MULTISPECIES: hypothetical protein [Xanthomonas]KER81458.1 hypothetical protein IA64_15680 [Xanthomonas arboricola pv. celebensis]MCC8443900.1 hypothetical protein [Xanthomonas cannabis]MDN0222785.1 hypothetical protein [Xanthomonas arboricola pv. juglandis]MDN0227042.1 hypothetical protein [Xanthomonas arboricola pv. juglandis]MDN0231301.1 hypothetical protein [Xanthomonas arboricola pv. juglandis]
MAWVENIDSLYDFIGVVVLRAPDKFQILDFLPPEEQLNLDRAFDELRRGIDFIEPEMADEKKRKDLASLLDLALTAYKNGDEYRGAHLVQDFQDLIFKRNY